MDKAVLRQKVTAWVGERQFDGSIEYNTPPIFFRGRYEVQRYVTVSGQVFSDGLRWRIWTSDRLENYDITPTQLFEEEGDVIYALGWIDTPTPSGASRELVPVDTNVIPDLSGNQVLYEIGG